MPKLTNFLKLTRSIHNWPSYLIDYWFNKKGVFSYKTTDGNKFFIDSRSDDRFILNEIYVHNIYTNGIFKIRETDTIVDIGAHIGIFSMYAAKKAKNGLVFSYEPAPKNFSLLKKHTEINNIKNIKIFNLAVDNKKELKKFYVARSDRHSGRHSFYKPEEISDEIIVKSTTLASILKDNGIKKINLLKFDCEGAEYRILLNCKKETLDKIDRITMEYHNLDQKRNVSVLSEFLEKNGFKTFKPKQVYPTGMFFAIKRY
ncbi:FkbM family methyltransferase [Candidatus Pacearchaeota archaeon]|nr:FkbM family methyltransferase [Candidatus Pacearchaeota archaeon]